MIKAICFDLDGVLCSTKELHFRALNLALADIDQKYVISYEKHLKVYDGLTTYGKLGLLSLRENLPIEHHKRIWESKQLYTEKLLKETIKEDKELFGILFNLKKQGYLIYVATNSIKKTTFTILAQLGIWPLFNGILTNEDVICGAKPSPSIYLQCMLQACCCPNELLVIEDSINGVKAAQNSGAQVLIVKDRDEVTLQSILNKVNNIDTKKMKTRFPFNGNIVIPMAGLGSRFQNAGYVFPKPLIETINHKPMIQLVVESLGLEGHYIYLVQKEHLEKYNLKQMLNLITPNCDIVEVNGLTPGACCTTLLAEKFIDNDKELIIANSDQYIEWKPEEFFYLMNNQTVDGGILTFENTHPKWSYVKVDNDGYVTEVAEKNPISNHATVGVYYYKKGSDYVKYSYQMIKSNFKVNGEFYVAPVWNEFIEDGKRVKIYDVDRMIGCGTPEDLNNLFNILN